MNTFAVSPVMYLSRGLVAKNTDYINGKLQWN